jgi:hypothetical protein
MPSGAHEGETSQDERVDDVVVKERIVLGLDRRCGVHEQQHGHSADRGDSHPDTQEKRRSDSEQPDHEGPVDQGAARKRLIELGEGTLGRELKVPDVGEPPLSQELSDAVANPSPNSLSMKAQKKIQPTEILRRPHT